ncbi:MAG: hypothetical protein BWX84_00748 [Verrucomicrobia bacterium ADurb.Bin118]|nr:MAG: hypothetical protein BWX84_00748 [Verrucomicrobia bacterium ADurb.Bin118]
MNTMKKIVILLSVMAMSFAVYAGEGCAQNKAACSKEKAAVCCDKAKKSECTAKAAANKECCKDACPTKANQTAKRKQLKSPKAS